MKGKTALTAVLAGAAGLIGYELAARRLDRWAATRGVNYWRSYYTPQVQSRSDRLRRTMTIRSTGVRVHIDIYAQQDREAPVVILNHGAAGYCRMFIPLALGFYERGYTVLVPDQRGNGFSGGTRGDFTIGESAQNILDVALWAKGQFDGPLYAWGGSIGGALCYYAAALGAPLDAIACLNLMDFSDPATTLTLSRSVWLAELSLATRNNIAPLVALAGGLRMPFAWFGRFDALFDRRDAEIQRLWEADPVPARRVSVRLLFSMMTTPPAVPFEANRLPVLVLNQGGDRMIDPALTRASYDRLGGPKEYAELEGFGHWSMQPGFIEGNIEAADSWFRSVEKS